MKIILALLFFLPALSGAEQIHHLYFKNMFGHIHQGPSSYSGSVKSLSCGDRVVLVQDKGQTTTEFSKFSWARIKYGPSEGYVRAEFLEQKRPTCFSFKYSKFVNKFKLELNDIFSWGRLYDQYVTGSSKAR